MGEERRRTASFNFPRRRREKRLRRLLASALSASRRNPHTACPQYLSRSLITNAFQRAWTGQQAERPQYVRRETKWSDYATIWQDDAVKQRRNGVLKFLRQQMPADRVLHEPHLERLSATKDYFQQQPEMNAVGY